MEDPPGYCSYTIKIPKYLSDYVVLIRIPFAIQGRISSPHWSPFRARGGPMFPTAKIFNHSIWWKRPLGTAAFEVSPCLEEPLEVWGDKISGMAGNSQRKIYMNISWNGSFFWGVELLAFWIEFNFASQYCPWLCSGSEPTNTATFDISPNLSVEVWADITCWSCSWQSALIIPVDAMDFLRLNKSNVESS